MAEFNATRLAVAVLISIAAWNAAAQVSVKTPGQEVKVGKGTVNARAEGVTAIATDGGKASVTIGGIEGDADIQGVTVINGRVSIDGAKFSPTSRAITYAESAPCISSSAGTAVSVTAEEGRKMNAAVGFRAAALGALGTTRGRRSCFSPGGASPRLNRTTPTPIRPSARWSSFRRKPGRWRYCRQPRSSYPRRR
jgi:hypothetical protein